MLKKLLFFFFLLFSVFSFSQNLTVDETTNYIKNLTKGDFSIKKDGEVKIEFQDYRRNKTFIQGVIYIINEVYFVDYKNQEFAEYGIKIKCKENFNCLKCYVKNNTISDDFIKPTREKECGLYGVNDTSENSTHKLKNSLEYISDIASDEGYSKNNDDFTDPFSSNNFKSKISKATSINDVENDNIKLQKNGSLFYLNISINGYPAKFILDTGASDLTINEDLEKILIGKNIIKKEDYISSALYKIADGSIRSNRRLILKNIKIGNFTIQNVRAAVSNNDSPLLLGKSLLDNFKMWSIDNQNMTLKLQN